MVENAFGDEDAVHVADHFGVRFRRVGHRLQQVDGAVAENIAGNGFGLRIRQQRGFRGAQQQQQRHGFFDQSPVLSMMRFCGGDRLVMHEAV